MLCTEICGICYAPDPYQEMYHTPYSNPEICYARNPNLKMCHASDLKNKLCNEINGAELVSVHNYFIQIVLVFNGFPL